MNNLNLRVSLSFQELTALIQQLSPAEKLKLNDVIWNENIEIPVEHQRLVLQRIEKSKFDPKRMLDWDKASKTLKS
jgi:hypothetical protein